MSSAYFLLGLHDDVIAKEIDPPFQLQCFNRASVISVVCALISHLTIDLSLLWLTGSAKTVARETTVCTACQCGGEAVASGLGISHGGMSAPPGAVSASVTRR